MELPSYVGRYAIRHEIARGGFAVVLLAWDEELDCAVALKILDAAGSDAVLQARFIDEARMLRRVRSRHVVTVHDVGRLNDGRPYFIMDFADRGTLANWLKQRLAGPHDQGPATHKLAAFVDALAEGLGAIHHAGIVHRDIKPANILFQSVRSTVSDPDATIVHPASSYPLPPPDDDLFDDVRILVGDLGIAKDVAQGGAVVTLLGGTPAYQAPEQLDPEQPVTAAADVYSATAVLYQLIAGIRPPQPNQIEDSLSAVPGHWRGVLRRGLALEPGERFASIQSWRAAVQDVLAEAAADTESATTAGFGLSGTQVSPGCPYKGLGAYQPEDADKFYGREALTEELVRRIQMLNVLIVGGASGSGKSSLVRAGLIPALRAGAAANSTSWRIALLTPGRDALAELYFHLVQSLGSPNHAITPDDFMSRPTLARRLASPTGSEPPLVLCIDQFEELFTLSPPAQQGAFIDALSSMADPADSQVRIVIAVRADYYATCAQIPWLAERITDNQVLVGPMGPTELRRAISEPARQGGLYLERNLIDTIIEEAGNNAGSLPLVAHAMVETWMRRKGATLTLEGYRAAGGVAGAIAQTAGMIFEQRFSDAERDVTHRLFLRLVTPGEGAGDTRRIVERTELESDPIPELTRRVVEQLTDARLLTVDTRYIQIAHEALLGSWPRLRQWIDEARDDLRLRQRLFGHAQEWEASNREPDLLLRGTPLLSAIEWQAKNPKQGGALVQEFIEASAKEKEHAEAIAQERQARARRVRTAAVTALSLLTVGAIGASIFAYLGYRDAHRNELAAAAATRQAHAQFALALGAVSAGMAHDDPRLALYLSGEAQARQGTPGHDARAAMVAAREELAGDGPHLLGGPIRVGDALSLAISPDGAFLAVGGRDGSIMVVDTAARQRAGPPVAGHKGGVQDLAFSPDGLSLASAGDDGKIKLWPLKDGFIARGEVLGQFSDIAWAVAFSPTGDRLAAVSEDQTVRLWDTERLIQIGQPVAEGIGDGISVAFGPDGKAVLVGTGTGMIQGWRLPSREPLMPKITGIHTSDVWGLLFGPGGDRFASVSSDGTSALFSYPEGRYLGRAFKGGSPVSSAAFTHDGTELVGAGEDGRLHVWNLRLGAPSRVSAVGHQGRISAIALSDDGHLAATLGRDQTVRLWTLADPVPISTDRRVDGAAKGVAISSDGTIVAAANITGSIYVWRAGTVNPRTFVGHARQVWALAISPDGRILVSGDRSGEVRTWDTESGELVRVKNPGHGAVWWLGFTPDGGRLISAADRAIDIYDAASGDRMSTILQDAGRITRAAISPNGTLLAVTATDGRVRLLDLVHGSQLRELSVVDDVVWSAAFSPDSRSLAVASSDEVVSLWDVRTGKRQGNLAGHSGGATDLAYLPDGATLAVVDRRGKLHLWDTVSKRRLAAPISAHTGAAWRLAEAAAAPGVFVTSGDDGEVRVWDILSVARACEIGAPAFDQERQREYLGEGLDARACASRPGPLSKRRPVSAAAVN